MQNDLWDSLKSELEKHLVRQGENGPVMRFLRAGNRPSRQLFSVPIDEARCRRIAIQEGRRVHAAIQAARGLKNGPKVVFSM